MWVLFGQIIVSIHIHTHQINEEDSKSTTFIYGNESENWNKRGTQNKVQNRMIQLTRLRNDTKIQHGING